MRRLREISLISRDFENALDSDRNWRRTRSESEWRHLSGGIDPKLWTSFWAGFCCRAISEMPPCCNHGGI